MSKKNEKFTHNFKTSIINEWINGWAKLIGWIIPITILMLFLQPITDLSLKIDKIDYTIKSDKNVLSSSNNKIDTKEFNIDKNGTVTPIPVDKQRPNIFFKLTGKGKIDKAFYFFKPDQFEKENNNMIKYQFDINSSIAMDLLEKFTVTPSSLELPNYLNIRIHRGEPSRSYLVLRDAHNKGEFEIFLIYLKVDKKGNYHIESIIDEKKINQTFPNKYEKNNPLTTDLEDIQKEIQEIKSILV